MKARERDDAALSLFFFLESFKRKNARLIRAENDEEDEKKNSTSSLSLSSFLPFSHLLSPPPPLLFHHQPPLTLPPQYDEGSAPALALQATIDRTDKRFANYAKAGLLCGTDGLPHLISDPGLALRYGHAGETLIPTIGFLYVAGWIGSVGREYIQTVAKDAKPTEKEIIIDVPLALSLAAKGAGWPAKALTELRNGTLLEKDENITISPR